MSLHLEEISTQIADGAHTVVILDRAEWHTAHDLDLPDNISLLFLPPHSPEPNPIENFIQLLLHNFLNARIDNTHEDIVDACCWARTSLLNIEGQLKSIATRYEQKRFSDRGLRFKRGFLRPSGVMGLSEVEISRLTMSLGGRSSPNVICGVDADLAPTVFTRSIQPPSRWDLAHTRPESEYRSSWRVSLRLEIEVGLHSPENTAAFMLSPPTSTHSSIAIYLTMCRNDCLTETHSPLYGGYDWTLFGRTRTLRRIPIRPDLGMTA